MMNKEDSKDHNVEAVVVDMDMDMGSKQLEREDIDILPVEVEVRSDIAAEGARDMWRDRKGKESMGEDKKAEGTAGKSHQPVDHLIEYFAEGD